VPRSWRRIGARHSVGAHGVRAPRKYGNVSDTRPPKAKAAESASGDPASCAASECRAPDASERRAPLGPWHSRERAQKAANIYWIVENKRRWSEPLSEQDKARGFLGWHTRGYLPHFDAPGVTQFLTLRLVDAMPASRRSEWEVFDHLEDERERRKRIEEYLDRGLGECHLRSPAIAKLVRDALQLFDGERYALHAWVIMPNHVHVLFTQHEPLGKIISSWKRFTATEANKLLRRTGTAFWQEDYFDVYMRDEGQFRRAKRYIENNPVNARLVRSAEEWPWSSAGARHSDGAKDVRKPGASDS